MPDGRNVLPIAFVELRERCDAQMDLSVCSGCDACGLRCAAGAPASRREWLALSDYIASLGADARRELARVEAQDKAMDLGDGVTVRMCRYRDMERGGCAVYPARPLVCRLLGHVEWMPCPIDKVRHRVKTADGLALMAEYSKQRRNTFDAWEQLEATGPTPD
jgi:Fe-S-cluster containining protein